MIGSTIGSHRITGLLGEGGMGVVYQAIDNIERIVAIKALHPQVTRDEARLQRFRSEAIALGRLHHPNIASLFHLLEQDDNFYMVMEFVEGPTLADIIRQSGALPVSLSLEILIDGLHGFEHAHERGVIHRDIKPSNLIVATEGLTKITDFGIARMSGGDRLTKTGTMMGTLEYMSPEQVRGLEQDARSDIYSLGILLFELLTGRVPFTNESDFDLMRSHIEKPPISVRHFVASLPVELDEIIAKALAKDPDLRFQSVAEMRSALEAVAQNLSTDSGEPATPIASSSASTPQTSLQISTGKYATRLVGSPLPVVSQDAVSTAPPPVVSAPVASTPTPQSVASKQQNIPMVAGMGGVALLVAGLLAFAAFRPAPKREATVTTAITKQPTSNSSVSKQERAIVVTKPPSSRERRRRKVSSAVTRRRAVKRTISVNKPKLRRRFVREVVQTRPSRVVKRASRPRLSGSDEGTILRNLLKDN